MALTITNAANQAAGIMAAFAATVGDPYAKQLAAVTVTDGNTATAYGSIILGNRGMENAFVSALVNRIAYAYIKTHDFRNRFAAFKKRPLSFGMAIEEIFVGLPTAHAYDPSNDYVSELFSTAAPDVKAALHPVNVRCWYKETIKDVELTQAFTSDSELVRFTNEVISKLTTALDYDLYLCAKYAIALAAKNGLNTQTTITGSTRGDVGSALAYTVKRLGLDFAMVNADYSIAGVLAGASTDDVHIICTTDAYALMDVYTLAKDFNVEYSQFRDRVDIIDHFGLTSAELARISALGIVPEIEPADGAVAAGTASGVLVCTEDFIQFYDKTYTMDDPVRNSPGRLWNYFLSYDGVMSYSPFAKAVMVPVSIT